MPSPLSTLELERAANTEIPLVCALIERQGDSTARAFARRLGVNHELYIGVLNGTRNIGLTLLQQVAAAYPELYPLIGQALAAAAKPPTTNHQAQTQTQ